MKRVKKIAEDSGTFSLSRTAAPGFSDFGFYVTEPHVLQPFPEDGVANVWLVLRVTNFSSIPHHIYFNVFDSVLYPQRSAFDANYEGWITQQLASPVLNQQTNNTVYLKRIKDYQAAKGLRLGFVVQHVGSNPLVDSTVDYQVEAWCEY